MLAGMAQLPSARRYLSCRRLTMCTVTFIARQHGYVLGMNRDENLARVPGLPPTKKIMNGCRVLSPSDPGGGTWIALNDSGVTFALINWYSIASRVKGETISRGLAVNAASSAKTPDATKTALTQLPLKQINPFRLVGIFPATREIVEWRWNLKMFSRQKLRWQHQQWISSGFDEPAAQRVRSQTFRKALNQNSVGSRDWLRRLHRSHAPQSGPFSICMHRADAATVSFTEVAIFQTKAIMTYHDGSLCNSGPAKPLRLSLKLDTFSFKTPMMMD